MKLEVIMTYEINQTQTDPIPYDSLFMRFLKKSKTESRMMVPSNGGRRMGYYCLIGAEFQFYKGTYVLRFDYTTM